MERTLTLGSLFDGSGGFPLAGSLCGVKPVWASEVEPYPITVTKSRFPNMKHLGDITKIKGGEIEPVDIITFGSPCQDLSVAGKRAGLKHEANGDDETTRSGLFMEAVRIIKEMRKATNGKYPTFALWENVPGAFSSNGGEDFRIVLEELIKVVEPTAVMPPVPKNGWPYADSYVGDGWSLAYRVFDAQYWGVPQRRRRIHLVVDFRGERARQVSFEREGLRGYFTQGRTPWKGTPAHAENGSGADDRTGEGNCLTPWDVQSRRIFTVNGPWPALYGGEGGGHGYACIPYTLKIRSGCEGGGKGALIQTDKSATLATNNDQYLFQPIGINGDVAGTLDASYYKGCGMRQGVEREVVCVPASFYPQMKAESQCFRQDGICNTIVNGTNPGFHNGVVLCMATQQGGAEIRTDDKAPTITAAAGMSGNNQPVVALIDSIGGQAERGWVGDVAPTLKASHYKFPPSVAVPCVLEAAGFKAGQSMAGGIGWQEEKAATLSAQCSGTEPTVCIKEQHLFENHSQDSRYRGPLDVCPMLPAQLGTGGNNQPFVVEPAAFTMQGFGDYKDCGMASGLKARDYKDATDLVVSMEPASFYPQMKAESQCFRQDGINNTIVNVTNPGFQNGVVQPIAIDRAFFNQGQNALYDPQLYEDGTNPTLVARGPNAVAVRYIVRRLTPTECARLQGFADRWGDIDQKESLTDEEYKFWHVVRNTHAAINGKKIQTYTESQMLTWYNKLHTDSAEYKMWGNGIALPPALYCMQGMVEALATDYPQTETIEEPLTVSPVTDEIAVTEEIDIPETIQEDTPEEIHQEVNMDKNKRIALREMGHEDAFLFESPDFDTAIIGVTADGQVVYDYDAMVRSLMTEATEDEATEFVNSVTIKSTRFVRDKKPPIIMYPLETEE